ncbi:MAG: protein kinase domain-containing protein, partial [Verrucomicrobiota bacterium]
MPTSPDPRIGSELAGYRLEELVGRGGMGVVYRAQDLALERPVALKLLSPGLAADRDFRQRFLVESRLAAALDHPCVVPIYDAGEAEDQLYLVMRYVEGTDLKRLLQAEGKLDPARTIAVCSQLADALDTAHAHGLVHRDVKPSNVLLDDQGHAYLADFGLTRRLAEQATGFEAGLSLGTPAYVAPEQIEGNDVDGRADQYSLACLLHECLTGGPPFPRASAPAVLFAHLEEEPPAPAGLEHVLPRALAKDPADRYPSCSAFVADARRALGLEFKRARWPLALAGVGAVLVGAALLAFFLTRGESSAPLAGPAGRLFRIDPATSEVAATLRVGQNPNAVAVAGDGSVWVASHDDATVWKVDPDRNRAVLSVPAHGKPAELAAAGRQVFVSNGSEDASVVVIVAATGREEQVIRLGTLGLVSLGSALVAAGDAGLWVGDSAGRVGRLDLTLSTLADQVVLPFPPDERVDGFPSGVAVAKDAVWVVGDAEAPLLWRVDPASGDVETIPLDFAPKDVAVGEGAVWVTSQLDDTVSRIDPATHEVTATVDVGRGAAGIAVGAGSVWVANAVDGSVSRIDPATARVTKTIEVAGSAEDVVVGDGAVWVAGHEPAGAAGGRDDDTVRIGVLTACEGSFAPTADMSIAGAELPLL